MIRTEADRLALDYRHRSGGGGWQPLAYSVLLDWTPCNYGGRRAWFRCPATGCGRRMALLYFGSAGIFACRHCYRLAHACQRETDQHRAFRQADKLRARLGWPAGIAFGIGVRPKHMHRATFERLLAEYDRLVNVILATDLRW